MELGFRAFLLREFARLLGKRGKLVEPLIFFALIVVCFPLAAGVDRELLARLAPAVLWVSALLCLLLTAYQLFEEDFEAGIIDHIILSGQSLFWYVIAKALVSWTLSGLLLALLSPAFAATLLLPNPASGWALLAIAVGSVGATMINILSASLTVALRNSSILLSLISLPLFAPLLIFGGSVITAAAEGADPVLPFMLLSGVTLLATAICPLAAAFILRYSRELY